MTNDFKIVYPGFTMLDVFGPLGFLYDVSSLSSHASTEG
jgi:hypothetical protein